MTVGKAGTSVSRITDSNNVILNPKKPSVSKEIGNVLYSPQVMSQLPEVIASVAKTVNSPALESVSTNVHVIENAKNLGALGAGLSILGAPFKAHKIYTNSVKFAKRNQEDQEGQGIRYSSTEFIYDIAQSAGSLLSAVKSADKYVSGVSVPENAKPVLAALKQASAVVEHAATLVSSSPKLWAKYNDGGRDGLTFELKLLIIKVAAAVTAMTAAIAKLAECGGKTSSRPLVLKGLEVVGALATMTNLIVRILESHEKKVYAFKAKGEYALVARNLRPTLVQSAGLARDLSAYASRQGQATGVSSQGQGRPLPRVPSEDGSSYDAEEGDV